jgi:hypothetical protein
MELLLAFVARPASIFMMKLFVRENTATVSAMLLAMIGASALTGGNAGAVYLTAIVCLAALAWWDKRKETRS